MGSEKTLYWLAVGVMGIMFVQSASVRFEDRLNDLGGRSVQVAQHLSAGASKYLSVAEVNLGLRSDRCPRAQITVARLQSKIACAQNLMASRQAGFARMEAARARMQVRMTRVESRFQDETMPPSF
jgi:hypothetical protein